MMKKSIKIYALIWAILLAVFNVICFVTPSEVAGMSKFGGAFWAGYIFITLAFIGQLVCAYIALRTDDKQKLFYNIPVIRISYTGLILTLVFGALCMAIPNLPNWVGITVCFLVLAFTAIAVIKATAASDIVGNVDGKIKSQTFLIKSLTVDAENLLARAKSEEAKSACKKVYDAVRYSDPMSNGALAGIESQIALKFAAFADAVEKNEDVKTFSDELVILVNERNNKCRMVKYNGQEF